MSPDSTSPTSGHTSASPSPGDAPLGLWDTTSIMVGIVVGVSIFEVPPLVFNNVASAWQGLAVWIAVGLLALVGALCYAELATTWPRSGGDYVYLSRAYGPLAGFLFGWANLAGILTGSIGAMVFVFGDYAARLWNTAPGSEAWFAMAAVVGLTLLNLMGVVVGKQTQNLLTASKVLGIGGILVAGFLGTGSDTPPEVADTGIRGPGLGLAMILVLYAYGGWNDTAFVAAEVRDPRRNLPRSLILGTIAITAMYLLINLAYLRGLGFAGLRESSAPAADVLQARWGEWGARGMSVLVMISALGAANGLILTGARVHASMGADFAVFAWLSRWHPRLKTPIGSLLAQAIVTLTMIALIGTPQGRGSIDTLLQKSGLQPLPWSDYGGGFGTLVAATAPLFWAFFLLTGLALISLRDQHPHRPRPFSVPFYPFLPFLFCLACTWMLHSSLTYAAWLTTLALVPMLPAPLVYLLSRKTEMIVDSSEEQ